MFLLIFLPLIVAWWYLRSRQTPLDISYNVLFVTAHPDDELMFFGPTLLHELRSRVTVATAAQNNVNRTKVHLLCLSNGDFYGDGERRAQELSDACRYLIDYCANFDAKRFEDRDEIFELKVIQDDRLPDSPDHRWSADVVRRYVREYIAANRIGKVITFDRYGISGHSNHVAIYHALSGDPDDDDDGGGNNSSEEFRNISNDQLRVWHLSTVPLWRKYLSVFDLVFTAFNAFLIRRHDRSSSASSHINLISTVDYIYLIQSLRRHRSQMLWFRYLYALTSRYMLANDLILAPQSANKIFTNNRINR